MISVFLAPLVFAGVASARNINNTVNYTPPSSFAVIPGVFESRNYSQAFVPENFLEFKDENAGSQPHFQVFDQDLAKNILGSNPEIVYLVSEPGYFFAHEAPVYFPDGYLYWCSDAGGSLGRSNATHNNQIFRMNLVRAIDKLEDGDGESPTFKDDVEPAFINSTSVQMTNGGTNYKGDLLLANSGRTERFPGTLALVNRQNPTNVTTFINNAFGKQFTAINDVVVHESGSIFFTDAIYGYKQGFRPAPDLPQSTWRFEPVSGRLTALDDSLTTPNGLCLSPDGKKLYISDTSSTPGGAPPNASVPCAIYSFDVNETADGKNQYLSNKRLFTWVHTGLSDGLKVDTEGNLYAGDADGVSVYSPDGVLILKVFLPTGAVNLVFAEAGQLVVLSQEQIFLVKLSNSTRGVDLNSLPK